MKFCLATSLLLSLAVGEYDEAKKRAIEGIREEIANIEAAMQRMDCATVFEEHDSVPYYQDVVGYCRSLSTLKRQAYKSLGIFDEDKIAEEEVVAQLEKEEEMCMDDDQEDYVDDEDPAVLEEELREQMKIIDTKIVNHSCEEAAEGDEHYPACQQLLSVRESLSDSLRLIDEIKEDDAFSEEERRAREEELRREDL